MLYSNPFPTDASQPPRWPGLDPHQLLPASPQFTDLPTWTSASPLKRPAVAPRVKVPVASPQIPQLLPR